MNQKKTAIQPTRSENYPEWYQQVIRAADLAENSPVRGCMVIKPWGYGIWENIQQRLDVMFKDTGHENAYFPLLIPMSFLEKEAEHIEGFAKECAVVTHHRLEPDGQGGLKPAGPLEEPLIIRPTSETLIGAMFSKWVQSYRDLPIKINQWANVMRWEMRTRMFLRTSEFLWQEGHTVHATEAEAWEETRQMLDVYADFAENHMAMPVIKGEKTETERFPGAVATLTIEAMMQDRKALQAGTSHFLGQTFSRAQDIKFHSEAGQEEYAWTTSWGVSTRLIGALIMTHSDDDGLVLPPRLAPKHLVISPIYRDDTQRSQVLEYCQGLIQELNGLSYDGGRLRIWLDDRDIRGGEKKWQHVKKGVPVRLEIGARDIAQDSLFVARRDQSESRSIPRNEFVGNLIKLLDEIQHQLYQRALTMQQANTHHIDSLADFRDFFGVPGSEQGEEDGADGSLAGGFVHAHWSESPEMHAVLKELKVTPRCMPLNTEAESGTCIFSGQPSRGRLIFAKAY